MEYCDGERLQYEGDVYVSVGRYALHRVRYVRAYCECGLCVLVHERGAYLACYADVCLGVFPAGYVVECLVGVCASKKHDTVREVCGGSVVGVGLERACVRP